MEVRVSIIVPVYKPDLNLLKKCLDSLIEQSYNHLEILLIDDNNNYDETGFYLEDYAKDFKNIKVLHKKNGGVSSARNLGLNYVTGDYVVFVDADDFLESDAIEKLLNAAKVNEADFVMASCYVHVNKNKYINHFYPKEMINTVDIEDLLLQTLSKGYSSYIPDYVGVGVPWAKLFKTDIIKTNNISFNEKMTKYEDLDFLFKYMHYIDKLINLRSPIYNYLVLGSSLSHGFNKNIFELTKASLNELEKTVHKYYSDVMIESTRIKKINEINSVFKQYILNSNNKMKISEKLHYLSIILNDSYFLQNSLLREDMMTKKEKIIYFLIRKKMKVLLLILFSIVKFKDKFI